MSQESKKNLREFDHRAIEARWKKHWFDDNIYRAEDFSPKPKRYILAEFPYPSGTGLHVGHLMRFTTPEVYTRKLRMDGYNVMYPMGWDAFGLPAENFAVKTGIHPAVTTRNAINSFRKCLQDLGYGIDWSREVDSTNCSKG